MNNSGNMEHSNHGAVTTPIDIPTTTSPNGDLPFVSPRKTPRVEHKSLTPPHPADTITLLQSQQRQHPTRTPPTPDEPSAIDMRRRSLTAPSTYRRATVPTSDRENYAPPLSPRLDGQTLGLSRRVSQERFGDRIKEIQGGDGEMLVDDAVSPELLPSRAVPHHFHQRQFSTSTLPPVFDQEAYACLSQSLHTLDSLPSSRSITPLMSLGERDTSEPVDIPATPCDHVHALGSHSPLSTCEPLTPRSLRGTPVKEGKEGKATWTVDKGTEGEWNGLPRPGSSVGIAAKSS